MATAPTTALLLAAAPQAPGAARLVARALERAAASPVRVLLSGDGLAWAADARLGPLAAAADVAVCSRNARAAGWTAATTVTGVRWSSVATWLIEWQGASPGTLWAALP